MPALTIDPELTLDADGAWHQCLVLPAFLEVVPDELWVPTWWEMDGQSARVYALNLEKSQAANRVLMDDAY